ncbi:MAG: NgoPII family restriction endonuclease [Microbacteriaceae bacterium]
MPIDAIKQFIQNAGASVQTLPSGSNRANSAGAAFEQYVKEAFAGILGSELSQIEHDRVLNSKFSWLGDDSMSPDAMIRGGVALEIKKSESRITEVALNSSHPRQKLLVDDPRVSSGAKAAEDWTERDLVYVFGQITNGVVERLWIVYGDCLAANAGVYSEISDLVSEAIVSNVDPQIMTAKTNELARLNGVDPQARTNLRVRPMWQIAGPERVFGNLDGISSGPLIALVMRESTFQDLGEFQTLDSNPTFNGVLKNRIVAIPDPDTEDAQIEARFISYEY